MGAPLAACADHGPFAGEVCPDCGSDGRRLLSADRRTCLSKYVSGALRHFPADAGIELDEAGWTAFDDLVAATEAQYDWAGREELAAAVAADPKGRFERDESAGDRIRAAYGHSVDVELDGADGPVPDELYHGTAPRNLDAVCEEGLRPMGRQQVHLSESVEAAREVGRRHAADPVVLSVDAAAMERDECRIAKRGEETFTTDRVPPAYLAVEER